MDEKDNIELRSEKVRNIIGGVPPRLVRAGTVVIILKSATIIQYTIKGRFMNR